MLFMRKTTALPSTTEALPGRAVPVPTATRHFVNGHPLQPPYPQGLQQAVFGLGCFWGAERKFWELGDGVHTTAVGYAGGHTPNPTYEEVCSGRTGHTEVVLVVFDPKKISYHHLLRTFWESHNPTQGMRQGNDIGTQYRSAVCTFDDAQRKAATESKAAYQRRSGQKALARSRPRSRPPANSILPRTIISNIWPRTRPAIADSAAPACRVRSEPASAHDSRAAAMTNF
jgi:peptide-methionine (S)-S-oxide reductase